MAQPPRINSLFVGFFCVAVLAAQAAAQAPAAPPAAEIGRAHV